MFDDAKYMAKDAVDRNNAIAALDQQRGEDKVHSWAKNRGVRRAIGVVLGLVIVAFPVITSLNEPRVFVVYVLAWISILALARTAMRAGRAEALGKPEFVLLGGLAVLSTGVALSAQTDVNLAAGVTATAGVAVAVVTAAVSAPAIVRCWR